MRNDFVPHHFFAQFLEKSGGAPAWKAKIKRRCFAFYDIVFYFNVVLMRPGIQGYMEWVKVKYIQVIAGNSTPDNVMIEGDVVCIRPVFHHPKIHVVHIKNRHFPYAPWMPEWAKSLFV